MQTNHWYLSNEVQLTDLMARDIAPFWSQQVTQGSFVGDGNIRVNYACCIPQHAERSVLISSGRIESLLKYKEVIYELYRNGFAVFILDHRGQGLSGRMRKNAQQGYVDHFSQYVGDMCRFIDEVVIPKQCGELNLLCHSMGSAIGALTVLQRPELFNRVVFCSPMFGIRPALPDWLGRVLITVNNLYNRLVPGASGYFFGQRDYCPVAFGDNPLTASEIRYKLFRTEYSEHPEIQLGGVTAQWLAAASAAMWEVEQCASEIKVPVLAFCAEQDRVVDNQRQARVIAGMPHAEYVHIAGARHELLIESDSVREPVMRRIFDFFSAEL
ncbi:alpha/beta fold hydrolase [Alteromonas lipolytica]|uniref:Lysophospholipase n=1 Tax=Alteromonas lipolytica TaxID=1856405 RepID=A0A1E8FBF3_9ALTE|nr:alpha/beta fold hydrolase [Alteromonas lipolytica]OFI33254.1 lysophospholipase [Alteromonas lipolytica]GGF61271.1 lysophospholipase L2 [Alteromonas lipolytica]